MRPYWSPKRLPKMIATATGETTNGSRTLIRHQVRPRRCCVEQRGEDHRDHDLRSRGQHEDAEGVDGLLEEVGVLPAPPGSSGGRRTRPCRSSRLHSWTRDPGGVDEREEPDDREHEEERRDVEVRREARVPPGEPLPPGQPRRGRCRVGAGGPGGPGPRSGREEASLPLRVSASSGLGWNKLSPVPRRRSGTAPTTRRRSASRRRPGGSPPGTPAGCRSTSGPCAAAR